MDYQALYYLSSDQTSAIILSDQRSDQMRIVIVEFFLGHL